jgi:hypothetical protein
MELDFDAIAENNPLTNELKKIDLIEFDIFNLRALSSGNELVISINFLMEKKDFYNKLNIDKFKFRKYSIIIQQMYNPIPYHNKSHAADVCQTCSYFMTTCGFAEAGQMTDLEQAVLLISGFVHDTDHPGYNNAYMVSSRDILALRYNDKAVLENHHIAIAFDTMLRDPSTCIYENFSLDEFKSLREDMINLVLHTDMSSHFDDMAKMKEAQASQEFDPAGTHKKMVMNMLIHLADISNPTKPWKICYKWIDLLFVEFFNQGDKEKELGLPISYLMDRATTNIAQA